MKKINRNEMLKALARGGVVASLVGTCAVLAGREEKFKCTSRCGQCPQMNHGMCSLGLK